LAFQTDTTTTKPNCTREPPHTFNYLEDARLPFSAKAKDVCDVAASLGQDGDQSFFKTQAEIQMDFAFRTLACAGMSVTLNNACEMLSSDALMKDIIDMLVQPFMRYRANSTASWTVFFGIARPIRIFESTATRCG